MSKNLQEKQDFHGTRDFYNLIKQCARKVRASSNLTEQELFNVGCQGLERNFGGFPDSTYTAKKFFLQNSDMLSFENSYINKTYDILNAIEQNLLDPHSRYLMIITKSSLSLYLLQFIMDNIKKKFNIFTGSQFGDQVKEDYSFKMLHKIMVSMEQGQLLVLNNLEFIYPSLYDVFNSNFNTVGQKKFTRIALGTTNNPLAPVHEDFRFVIIISSNDIAKQDPPFLQRFEKHILSFEDLLTEKEKQLGENFNLLINEVNRSQDQKKKFVPSIKMNCINCDKEEIFGLIKKILSKGNHSFDMIEDEILHLVSPTFSQEFLAALQISCLQNEETIQKIYKYYNVFPHGSFLDYFDYIANKLKEIKETDQLERKNLHIIYTYTSLFEELNFKNYFIDKYEKKRIVIESAIYRFQSEAEFESFFHDEFLFNEQKHFLILHFQAIDCIHLKNVKFLIDSFLEKILERNKCVIIIFHLEKLKQGESLREKYGYEIETMSNLSSWQQIMIDNLNPRHTLDIIKCLSLSFEEILNSNLDLIQIIRKSLYPAIIKIKYNVKNDNSFEINVYHEKLIELMMSNPMMNLLIVKIKKYSKLNTNWIRELLYSNESFQRNTDLLTILENFITNRIELVLAKLIGELEKANSLVFFFQEYEDELFKNKLYEIWKENYEKIKINDLMPIPNAVGIPVEKVQNLYIPLSIKSFSDVFINSGDEFAYYLKAYNKNEDNLRYLKIKEDEFKSNRKKVSDEFENYVYNKTIFMSLFGINKLLAQKCIMNDFLNYYLIYLLKEDKNHQIYIKFLQEIIEFKFHNEFFSSILWLYTYSNSIKTLLYIYRSEVSYMKTIVNSNDFKKVTVVNEDKNYEFKKPVNYDFLVILESIIELYLPTMQAMEKMSIENFFDYLNSLKCVYQNIQQFDYSLGLFSSKINDLIFWIELFSLITPEIDFENNVKKLIDIIEDIFKCPLPVKNTDNENYKSHIKMVKKVILENYKNYLDATNKVLTIEKNEKMSKFIVNFLMGLYQKSQISH